MLHIYKNYLEIVIPSTSIIGFFCGIININYNILNWNLNWNLNCNNNKLKNNNKIGLYIFINIIGYLFIGFITGLFFPITFPICTYYLLKDYFITNKAV
jgi:hypothetical protein